MTEIHVPRIARQGAAEHTQRLPVRHAAAGLVGQRHHAIDVRIGAERIVPGERVALEHVRHQPGHMGTAVHRREDADVVARRHPSVRAADALERKAFIGHRGRPGVLAIGVVLREIAHPAVVHVHMGARRDGLGGEADDLAIAVDRLALRQGPHRNLVAGRDSFCRGDAWYHWGARQQGGAGDHHGVVGMQADHRRGHGVQTFRAATTAALAAPSNRPLSLAIVTRLKPMAIIRAE